MGSISTGLNMASLAKEPSDYLCLARSNSFKVSWAYGTLGVLLLSGFLSTTVSFATIWLESRMAGMGVFAGCVFMLTGVLGLPAFNRRTSIIIQLLILSLLVVGAAAIVVAAAIASVGNADNWCRIRTLMDDKEDTYKDKAFDEVPLSERCQANRVIDSIIGACSLLSLIAAVVLFFLSLRGIPCGKRAIDE